MCFDTTASNTAKFAGASILLETLIGHPLLWTSCPVADPENFGGGGFEAQNLKNSDVFTKIETDFSAEIGNSNVFFAQSQVVSKKKKKKVFTKIETDFSPD